MNILANPNEKLFQRDPCPQVSKVTYNGSTLEVLFTDGTSSNVSKVPLDKIEHALLIALVQRAYTDTYELESKSYSGIDLHERLKALEDSIVYEDVPKSGKSFKAKATSGKAKLSKIATLLRNSN